MTNYYVADPVGSPENSASRGCGSQNANGHLAHLRRKRGLWKDLATGSPPDAALLLALGQGLAKVQLLRKPKLSVLSHMGIMVIYLEKQGLSLKLTATILLLITSPTPWHCLVTINYRNKWQG